MSDSKPIKSTFKQMVISVATSGWMGQPVMAYSISMIRDGAEFPSATDFNGGNPIPLTDEEAAACIAELTNSQVYKSWACPSQR